MTFVVQLDLALTRGGMDRIDPILSYSIYRSDSTKYFLLILHWRISSKLCKLATRE